MFLVILGNTILNGYETSWYPTPEYSKVEKICLGVCSDLDVLSFDEQLHIDWVENSDYLLNQFLILNNAIEKLVSNTEESRSYLLEDIHYLLESLNKVIIGYNKIYAETSQHPFCQFMQSLLHKSKENLEQLLLLNQEVLNQVVI
jgi:hypothetical protein